VVRSLNWAGIAFGAGAGLVLGLGLAAIAGGTDAGTGVQALILFLAFLVAGYLAGRFSLVGAVAAGGFAGLGLYFALAVVAIAAGGELNGIALLVFGTTALLLGSAGAGVADAIRRRGQRRPDPPPDRTGDPSDDRG
jgi:hypothetical protein